MLLHRQTHIPDFHLSAGRPEELNLMNLPGVIQIQTVMLQEPFTLNIPILIWNPGNAHAACRTHGKFIDRYLMAGMKIQRILSHQLFVGFGRNEIIISFQRNKTRINAAQKVHHDTSVKRIYLRYIPVYAGPMEPGINDNRLSPDRIGILIKEVPIPGNLPFGSSPRFWNLNNLIILRRVHDRIVVKLVLKLMHISKGIFHRHQLILLTDLLQAFLSSVIRLISGNKVFKHFPVHEPTLLDGGCIIAG